VYAHGFLTVDGAKMSKSRGTFIRARTYLDHLHPDYLRYYFAAKLGPGTERHRPQPRGLRAARQRGRGRQGGQHRQPLRGLHPAHFDGRLAAELPRPELYAGFVEARETIAADFEERNYQSAIRRIMALADEANRYIDEAKPWQRIKEPGLEQEVHGICTQGINLFRVLITTWRQCCPSPRNALPPSWVMPPLPAAAATGAASTGRCSTQPSTPSSRC
jgi:methionyl-tRNA synthetase